jgi:hypothetical protein
MQTLEIRDIQFNQLIYLLYAHRIDKCFGSIGKPDSIF